MHHILLAVLLPLLGLAQTPEIPSAAEGTNSQESVTESQETPEKLEKLAKLGIERVLTRILDAPVEVSSVSIVPGEEYLLLKGVSIGNPPGFDGANAMAAEEVRVDADVKSLFSRRPTIRLIQVKQASINAETKLPAGSNIMKLMNNAKQFKANALAERTQKQWFIEKAVLDGAKVVSDAKLIQERRDERTLGTIEMVFEGANGGGLPAEEAVAQFLSKIINELNIMPTDTPAGKALELYNLFKKH